MPIAALAQEGCRQVRLFGSSMRSRPSVHSNSSRLRSVIPFGLAMAVASVSSSAHGETWPTGITIEREVGSENCPGVDAVFDSIARLFPESPVRLSPDRSQALIGASISIRRTSQGNEASIRVAPPRGGGRTIVDPSPSCDGLADALAVALILLIEPGAPPTANLPSPMTPQRLESHPTNRGLAQTRVLADSSVKLPHAVTRVSRVGVMAGGIGGIGLLSRPAAGVQLGLTASHRSGWGIEGNAVRLLAAPAKVAPGQVELDLWAGIGGGCYRRLVAARASLEGCLIAGVGSQRGESRNYVSNGTSRRLWAVAGSKLQLNLPFGEWVGGFISLGVVGQLTRQAFSIEDVGIVASAPPAAIVFGLGLRVERARI